MAPSVGFSFLEKGEKVVVVVPLRASDLTIRVGGAASNCFFLIIDHTILCSACSDSTTFLCVLVGQIPVAVAE